MSSIQDIHALEVRIYDYVDDFINGRYNEDDVLAISIRCDKVSLKADAKEIIRKDNSDLSSLHLGAPWR